MGAMEKIYELVGLRGDLSQVILIGTLIISRIVPIVFQTPFLGGKLVPPETRMGLAVGLSVLIYPFAASRMIGPIELNGVAYVVLMFKELFIGYVIGFLATELFYAMEVAGRTLDVVRGSNMAEVQVPELQIRASPLGLFSFQLLLVTFCALNGHGYFIEAVIESFRVVAIDGWPVITVGFEHIVDQVMRYTASLFGIAVALVFPGAFASFLVDIVFGMFNRIAPQLNAYFMAMGVKALTGLAMFMFAMTLMVGQLAYRLEDSLIFLRRLISLLA